ncbi:MAG: DUF5667 domain-containing protein [Chloroflexota bacterium]
MSNPMQNFTDLLDDCIEAVVAGRLTIADCVARYPAHQAELAELLPLLTSLQAARQVTPAPAFRQSARQRLLERLEPVPAPLPTPPSFVERLQQWWQQTTAVSPQPSFAWSLALVFILFFFLGGGTLYAATQSLPGDMLYPLNQSVEDWRVELARDDQTRFELQLAFADKRLAEATRLARRGHLTRMEEALTAYQHLMQTVTQAVETAPPAQQAELAGRIAAATTGHDAAFTRLFVAASQEPGSEAPPPADEALMVATILCQPETNSSMTHPVANQLAAQYEVDYETIIGWFCQDFGFGEIGLAYNLSQQTETAVADLFALRTAGYGWGQIMQQYQQLLPHFPDEGQPEPMPTPTPPINVGPPNTPGPWPTPPVQVPPITPATPGPPPGVGPPDGVTPGPPPGVGPPDGVTPGPPPGVGPPDGVTPNPPGGPPNPPGEPPDPPGDPPNPPGGPPNPPGGPPNPPGGPPNPPGGPPDPPGGPPDPPGGPPDPPGGPPDPPGGPSDPPGGGPPGGGPPGGGRP